MRKRPRASDQMRYTRMKGRGQKRRPLSPAGRERYRKKRGKVTFPPGGVKNALPPAPDVVYLYTMKLSELFKVRTVFSAEVFPPKKTGTMENVIRALRTIAGLKPDFVSITCGAGGSGGSTTSDVCSVAKDAFDLETMAHFT